MGTLCEYRPLYRRLYCMSHPVPRAPDTQPDHAPPAFHLLAKPSGSTCNIDCTYCFFLSKDALYPNEKHRMSAATLEAYIRQCTVNAANEKQGRAVYRFFRDELEAKWLQFIPIVERATEETLQFANQGWLSEGPIRTLARRRAGPELSLCRSGTVFHAHRPDLQGDGPIDPAAPRARGVDGIDRGRRRQARTLSALPLRQRREIPFLSWRPCGACGSERRYARQRNSHSWT
jgi:hypothetical protein